MDHSSLGISEEARWKDRERDQELIAIALMSVMAKWYTSFSVDGLLEQDGGPEEWKKLNVVAERRVNCEHMQVLVTSLLQRHWEWQEDRTGNVVPKMHKYDTMYTGSLDAKTAFDVAQPKMVDHFSAVHANSLEDDSGDHERKDGRQRVGLFIKSRQIFGYSRCMRQESVEGLRLVEKGGELCALVIGPNGGSKRVGSFVQREEEGKASRLSSMVWADNFWLHSNNKEQLGTMVSELTKELGELEMEPKQESLWWWITWRGEEAEALTSGWEGGNL